MNSLMTGKVHGHDNRPVNRGLILMRLLGGAKFIQNELKMFKLGAIQLHGCRSIILAVLSKVVFYNKSC